MKKSTLYFASCLLLLFIFSGCFNESPELIRKKLDVILSDDLDYLVKSIPEEAVSDSAWYNIVSYKKYEKSKYSYNAVVEFFVFDSIRMKILRKYRYQQNFRKWERYRNEYKLIHENKDN